MNPDRTDDDGQSTLTTAVLVAADAYARDPSASSRGAFKTALRECLDGEVDRLANDLAGEYVQRAEKAEAQVATLSALYDNAVQLKAQGITIHHVLEADEAARMAIQETEQLRAEYEASVDRAIELQEEAEAEVARLKRLLDQRGSDASDVIVPCEPTANMILAGAKALDAWSDDALRESVDDVEMARRVWKAMTSAAR